ncbi:unnamed protein product, partial [Ectocarpus fasciculatus]
MLARAPPARRERRIGVQEEELKREILALSWGELRKKRSRPQNEEEQWRMARMFLSPKFNSYGRQGSRPQIALCRVHSFCLLIYCGHLGLRLHLSAGGPTVNLIV